MKMTRLGSNVHLVEMDHQQVLFSYQTAVAVRREGSWMRSPLRYSATTSKHLGQYAPGARIVSEEEFRRLLVEEA